MTAGVGVADASVTDWEAGAGVFATDVGVGTSALVEMNRTVGVGLLGDPQPMARHSTTAAEAL